MVQSENPAVFVVDRDALGNLFRGGCGGVYWSSYRVDGYEKICGGCGGGVLASGRLKIKVTVDSATEWREYGRCVAFGLNTSVSDSMEGKVRGSVRNF